MSWTVADVMTRGAITVSPSTSFDACETLRRIHGLGTLPVVHEGRLVGLFSESEVITTNIPTTTADTPLTAAVRQMFQRRVKRLPVVDSENRLVGIVSRSDILRVFLRSDLSIRDEVRSLTSKVGNGRVQPEVKDGVVILRGKMRAGSITEALERLVGVVPGVVSVKNELKVGVGDD